MSDYWILSTTPRLEEHIRELATLLQSKPSGEVKKLEEGGELLIYAEREESIALSREYFKSLWKSAQEAVGEEIKLEMPKTKPAAVLLQKKGWLSTFPNQYGIVIPIWNPDESLKEKIEIVAGERHYSLELAPRKMFLLSGDVRFLVPDNVPFDLILHPTSLAMKVEPTRE